MKIIEIKTNALEYSYPNYLISLNKQMIGMRYVNDTGTYR